MWRTSERGAVAVEFALLAPILIMLFLGIMEFGRAYNVQMSLTNAARESVRSMAISNSAIPVSEKKAAALAAANKAITFGATLTAANIDFNPSSCPVTPGAAVPQISVVVHYTLPTITGIAGPFAMTGKGTMLCGG
ncbi:Flp pilus assembly protein TadG [Arthrobacter pascens]|uniref:TadE/TadG family type IV pilus assembly protein n=1 Tax=Arthrobacter pascens TaxID=1677 RepID=UPI0027923B42|nr:TadE family protein [Arthrobacter pascens]MDQ0677556.1 Flp pilus assembly protein TadG [Arthrobacter pascens]